MHESFEALQKEGVAKLYYVPGDDLIGDDAEGTTDGSHPNDLGFVRRGFQIVAGERCGDHLVAAYLAKVNAMKRQFLRLAADDRD